MRKAELFKASRSGDRFILILLYLKK